MYCYKICKEALKYSIYHLDILLLFTHHYPETYKPKFYCRRQSGMNFGYVTVNGVNSNDILLLSGITDVL
jgi:hypothetical protein